MAMECQFLPHFRQGMTPDGRRSSLREQIFMTATGGQGARNESQSVLVVSGKIEAIGLWVGRGDFD
jgi:hypothetical protein